MSHYHIEAVYLNPGEDDQPADQVFPCVMDRADAMNIARTWVMAELAIYNATRGDAPYAFLTRVEEGSKVIGYQATDREGYGVRATIEEVDSPLLSSEGLMREFARYLADKHGDGSLVERDGGYVVMVDPLTAIAAEMMGLGRVIGPPGREDPHSEPNNPAA